MGKQAEDSRGKELLRKRLYQTDWYKNNLSQIRGSASKSKDAEG